MSHNRRQTRSPCERRLDHHPRCDRPAAHCAACGRTCGWDVDIAGNVRPAAAGSALWPAPNPMSDVLTGGGWQTLHWLLLLAALWLAIGVVGQIGRASVRERVCQYVSISVVAVSLKK